MSSSATTLKGAEVSLAPNEIDIVASDKGPVAACLLSPLKSENRHPLFANWIATLGGFEFLYSHKASFDQAIDQIKRSSSSLGMLDI